MKPILINAKQLKEDNVISLRQEVEYIETMLDRKPKLTIVKATNDKACEAYVRNKVRFGEEVGMEVEVVEIEESASELEVAGTLMSIVTDDTVDGVILQLPIYDHLDKEALISIIPPEKDADCFSIENLGKILQGNTDILSCTPQGVLDILRHHRVDIEGKRVTIIGRGIHTSLTLAIVLTKMGAVVTTTHSKTLSLKSDIENADIVISCVGKKNLIRPEWMKKGSVLIGVGIVFENGKQYTDYDIEDMMNYSECSLIGDRINCVGTGTTMSVVGNAIKLCRKNNNI